MPRLDLDCISGPLRRNGRCKTFTSDLRADLHGSAFCMKFWAALISYQTRNFNREKITR